MKGIPQTKDLNPARPGITEGFYIGMPFMTKFDLSLNTNNWSYNDLIHRGIASGASNNALSNIGWSQGDSLILDVDKFIGAIDRKNFAFESAALTFLEGGYKHGKDFYAVSVSEKEFGELFFDRNLIAMIKNGNYPYLGQTFFSGSFGINIQHYREFAFNYSHDISKKLTVGATAKILFGMVAINTNGLNFKVSSPPNGDFLDVSASGRLNISAPVQIGYASYGLINSVNAIPNYSMSKYFTNIGNPGLAFDLGFSYFINRKTEIAGSIVDLGFISWASHISNVIEHGNFTYRGFNMNDPAQAQPLQLLPIIRQLNDSVKAQFYPDSAKTNFTTVLPVKIYFGVNHEISDNLSIAALARVRILNNAVHTAFTASGNAQILRGISLSASYSILESTYDNIGLGIGFKIKGLQIYSAADNLFSPFHPSTARNISLRFGINLLFGQSGEPKNRNSLNPNCHCPN